MRRSFSGRIAMRCSSSTLLSREEGDTSSIGRVSIQARVYGTQDGKVLHELYHDGDGIVSMSNDIGVGMI